MDSSPLTRATLSTATIETKDKVTKIQDGSFSGWMLDQRVSRPLGRHKKTECLQKGQLSQVRDCSGVKVTVRWQLSH